MPPNVIVPDPVIGPPVNVKPLTVPAVDTLVTVPVPASVQFVPLPVEDKTCPLLPTSPLVS